MVVNVAPTVLLYPFPLPNIIPRIDRRPALYSANPLCTRLCFIRFMYTHQPPYKDKEKEEDDEDDLTLLINSSKFDISRATKVGGNEPYEAQPGREGIGGVQGGSPVSPW